MAANLNTTAPYKLATFTNAKRAFVTFYVFDTDKQALVRKQIFCPRSYSKEERKRWGKAKVMEINTMLATGATLRPKEEKKTVSTYKTIKTLWELYSIKLSEVRKTTGEMYEVVLKKFEAFLKMNNLTESLLSDITTSHIYLFRDYLTKDLKNQARTDNNNIILLGGVFKMAKKRGYIEKNPVFEIETLKEKESTKNVAFTKEHQQMIESYLQQNDPILYLFTRFIYCAFIRPKEVRQLTTKDIDLQKKQITVRGSIAKNGKTQIVPINQILFACLASAIDRSPNKILFGRLLVWLGAGQCSENYVTERHKKVIQNLGLGNEGYTLYSWKHTGASRAIEAGVNPRKLQGLLRHSSLEETDHYLRSLGISLQNEELKEVW